MAFLLNIGFLVFAFSRNDRHRASRFAALSGALLFYSVGYLLEIISVSPAEAMIALRIQNVGIPLLAPFFYLTALAFFKPRLIKPWMTISSVIYGLAMFLIILFNDRHHLYYSSIDMVLHGSLYISVLGKGPLYSLQQIVSISCMGLTYVTLGIRYVYGSEKLRNHMKLFIVGSLFGFAANLGNILGIIPLGLDVTPLALSIGLIFFAVGLYRYKLMDVIPLAFEMAVERMDDAIIVLDSDWCFMHCNQEAKKLFPAFDGLSGMERITFIENWPPELTKWSDVDVNFSMISPVTNGQTLQRASMSSIFDSRGKKLGISIIVRDVTEITNLLNQMELLAITDPLTGAFNRRYFMSQIDRQMSMVRRHNIPMSILMMDIDNFKNINDTYGHLAGDQVLQNLVQTLMKQMRTHDVLARYGGEEFIIMTTDSSETGLLSFAERLRLAIEETPVIFDEYTMPVTVSIGIVMVSPEQTYETAISAADRALYTAKENGRNQVVLGHFL